MVLRHGVCAVRSVLAACLAIGRSTAASPAGAAPSDYVIVEVQRPEASLSWNLNGVSGGALAGWGGQPSWADAWVYPHALLWPSPTGAPIDLHPAWFTSSWTTSASGGQQVGHGIPLYGSDLHALLWYGSAGSATDLHPAGFTNSWATGVSGGRQVGYGNGPLTGSDEHDHALLWFGSTASVVDLNPAGFQTTRATGVAGDQQVGFGAGSATGGSAQYHALLWTGTAESAVDLHPPGFDVTKALAGGDRHQVGYGIGPATGDEPHALLWSGSAGSVVDLNPPGFAESYACGVAGGAQVGWGSGPATSDVPHALMWFGSPESVVDLDKALGRPGPSLGGAPSWSQATGIDGDGNIVGIVSDSANLGVQAVWVPLRTQGVALSPPPALTARIGQTVALATRFTSTVDGTPVAGESVTFLDGYQHLGTAVTDSDGTATLDYVLLEDAEVGPHRITVRHHRSGSYGEAIACSELEVALGVPGFSLYHASGRRGETVTLRSLMLAGGHPLTGRRVQFAVAGIAAGEGLSDPNGVSVSWMIPYGLHAGAHDVTVTFVGDAAYRPAARTTAALTVLPSPGSPIRFSLYATSGSAGQTVILRSLVYCGGAPIAGKTVQFAVDGALVGTGISDAYGVECIYTIPIGMAAGTHEVTVSFGGDEIHDPVSRTTAALKVE